MHGKYSVGGITIQSELPMPELSSAGVDRIPDWTFQLGSRRARPPRSRWFHHWTAPRGRRWLSFGRDAETYVLRFARTATFRLVPDRRTIVCEGAGLVPERTIRHLFLNQVLPLALSRSAACILHASAVVDGGGAIGFAGHAGSGKSTLSAALSRAGSAFICDDALILERTPSGAFAIPMYGAARLWPDAVHALFGAPGDHPAVSHYTRKRLVRVDDAASTSAAGARVRVLCVLAPKDAMRRARRAAIREIAKRDAFMRLTAFTFQLDIHDPATLGASFERLSDVVDRVPVVELAYPWRLSSLTKTADQVLEALAGIERERNATAADLHDWRADVH